MNRGKLWREYKAPNGRKYYYNVKTKETTWTKPVEEEKPEPGDNKEVKFAFELFDGWYLLIRGDGGKLFYDSVNEKSYLETRTKKMGENNEKIIELMDKEKIILLIGMTRGFRDDRYHIKGVYDDIAQDINFLKQEILNDAMELERLNAEAEEEESEKEEALPQEEQDDHTVELLNNLEEEEEEQDVKDRLFHLFESFNLDVYSTWSLQSRKISNQADYFLVHDDTQREEMFEDWCAMKVAQLPEDESEAEDDDYEPTKYHYLSEIMYQLRDEINADTVADDILRGHRPLFKQYHICLLYTSIITHMNELKNNSLEVIKIKICY